MVDRLPDDLLRTVAAFLPCVRALGHSARGPYGVLRFWSVRFEGHAFERCMRTVGEGPVRHVRGRFRSSHPLGLIAAHRHFAGCSAGLRSLTLQLGGGGDLNAAWSVADHLPRLEALELTLDAVDGVTDADVSLCEPLRSATKLRSVRLRLRGCRGVGDGVVPRLATAIRGTETLQTAEVDVTDSGLDAQEIVPLRRLCDLPDVTLRVSGNSWDGDRILAALAPPPAGVPRRVRIACERSGVTPAGLRHLLTTMATVDWSAPLRIDLALGGNVRLGASAASAAADAAAIAGPDRTWPALAAVIVTVNRTSDPRGPSVTIRLPAPQVSTLTAAR